MPTSNKRFAIGLMSGTSADGVDVALVRTDGDSSYEFIDFLTVRYDQSTRRDILACARGATDENVIRKVEIDLTDFHAEVVETLLRNHSDTRAAIQVVGFHGHTILHQPDFGRTRQIGDGQRLADRLGIAVVNDFRSADMRAGGQGAPLVPLFHAMLFAKAPMPCVVLNIGGVANITWIDGPRLVAADTGPGCGLLDAWAQLTLEQAFDRDGRLAERGLVDSQIVAKAMRLPYFSLPFPRSADRFDFDSISVVGLSPADGAATLCAVTTESIARAIESVGKPKTTWVTGGGSKHPVIMRQLSQQLGDVRPVEDFGVRSDSLEAECFAWLAVRHLVGLPTTVPATTGCHQPTCGGVVYDPIS